MRMVNQVVTIESLKNGDRFEFLTARSEWAHNCFLPHPQDVLLVARSAFVDPHNQCRFSYLLEKFPKGRPQDWWGASQTQVRLLGPVSNAAPAADEKPAKKTKAKKK
ncbi:MAG: hypothetical protein K8U03_00580 [Planctomycetia bacterium]|nr:hypothetical protein [Planctomycetia bacterium]